MNIQPDQYITIGLVLGIFLTWFFGWLFSELDKSQKNKRKALLKLFKNKEDVEFMRTFWEIDE